MKLNVIFSSNKNFKKILISPSVKAPLTEFYFFFRSDPRIRTTKQQANQVSTNCWLKHKIHWWIQGVPEMRVPIGPISFILAFWPNFKGWRPTVLKILDQPLKLYFHNLNSTMWNITSKSCGSNNHFRRSKETWKYFGALMHSHLCHSHPFIRHYI